MSTTYETGAKSHAVNDLILFTENTKALAEVRDAYYYSLSKLKRKIRPGDFGPLFRASKRQYREEMPESCEHITAMTWKEEQDYTRIYLGYFLDHLDEQN